jgi:hypothetical protein
MHDSILFAAPLLIGAIVLAVRFVGCTFHAGAAAPVPYSTEVMNTAGLVSFWRLNEASGTTANDGTDGNAGTYENGVTLGAPSQVYTDTDPNTAAQFDGVSQYVDVPFAANINPQTFTVEAIANPSAVGDGAAQDFHAVVFSRINNASNQTFGFNIFLHGTDFVARAGTGTTQLAIVTVPAGVVANGGPYYLALSYDGATVTLYVNPVDPVDPTNPDTTLHQQASTAITYAPNTTAAFLIGASNSPGPAEHFFFPGVISDVAVYNVALDFHTIQQHYAVMMMGFRD